MSFHHAKNIEEPHVLEVTMHSRQLEEINSNISSDLRKFWFLVSNTDKKKKRFTETRDQTEEQEEKYILCKNCENKITLPNKQIEVGGLFEHTFLNPGGHVFRIGCFFEAEGCTAVGVPTAEWTWFEGFEWQVAICNQCNSHLGWFYRSMDDRNFFGLILDLLI